LDSTQQRVDIGAVVKVVTRVIKVIIRAYFKVSLKMAVRYNALETLPVFFHIFSLLGFT